MSDRELLEAAAKAAGIAVKPNFDSTAGLELASGVGYWWNPLTDDGDALRLAMHCGMRVSLRQADADGGAIREVCDDADAMAATRRAIVRAAAAVCEGKMSYDEFVLMFPGRFEEEEVERVRAAAAIGAQQGNGETL